MCICVGNWLLGKKHHRGSDDNYSDLPKGEKEGWRGNTIICVCRERKRDRCREKGVGEMEMKITEKVISLCDFSSLRKCSCVLECVYVCICGYSSTHTCICVGSTQHTYGFIRQINAWKNVRERAEQMGITVRQFDSWMYFGRRKDSYGSEYHNAFRVLWGNINIWFPKRHLSFPREGFLTVTIGG